MTADEERQEARKKLAALERKLDRLEERYYSRDESDPRLAEEITRLHEQHHALAIAATDPAKAAAMREEALRISRKIEALVTPEGRALLAFSDEWDEKWKGADPSAVPEPFRDLDRAIREYNRVEDTFHEYADKHGIDAAMAQETAAGEAWIAALKDGDELSVSRFVLKHQLKRTEEGEPDTESDLAIDLDNLRRALHRLQAYLAGAPSDAPQPPGLPALPYFRAPLAHQPIRSAFAHAAEGRGTEVTENEQALMILAPLKTRKKSGQLAYQTSLFPELTSCQPNEWIRQSLGLKAVRFSLGLEYYYCVNGDRATGTVTVWPEHLLALLGMTDRPENRHRLFEVITAMSALKVYHTYTKFEPVPTARKRKGKPPPLQRVTAYGYRPYITLEPLTLSRALEPHEAIRAIEQRQWQLFDGVMIKFAEPLAFDRAFYPMPTDALKLGSRKGAALRELQALALGEAIIRTMAQDWTKYGGRFQASLYPEFRHGHTGDWNHAKTQGLLHLAGLSAARRASRIEDAMPEVLECARLAGLCGIVDLSELEHGRLSVTAPLWLWDVMQESRRAYRGEEPDYVGWLRKREPEPPG